MERARTTLETVKAPLRATRPLRILDELRVPVELGESAADGRAWAQVGHDDERRAVHWYSSQAGTLPGRWSLDGFPLVGRVLAGDEVTPFVRRLQGRWRRELAVSGPSGAAFSWIWRSDEGGTIFPFDPDATVQAYRSEAYRRSRGNVRVRTEAVARRTYYALRPAVPRGPQIALRRAFARVQQQAAFPRWPVESALHDLCDLVLQRVADSAGAAVPYVAPWPDGRDWALVLTHDVEHATGRDAIEDVRSVEAALGLRSSWNLVPERYAVSDELVAHLWAVGCEVGVHGLRHDGRDVESLRTLRKRLPAMRCWAERWGATGFRSPATHRTWDWMPLLGFDYDTSSPDTDPYEPMPGGCCSWLPFFNRDLVELPITLAQDYTLFVLLRGDERAWFHKTEVLRRRRGMALLDTHPDYLLDPVNLRRYAGFLQAYAGDERVWHAVPREVSAWWRQRAATELIRRGPTWCLAGPAAERATVALAVPEGASSSSGAAR